MSHLSRFQNSLCRKNFKSHQLGPTFSSVKWQVNDKHFHSSNCVLKTNVKVHKNYVVQKCWEHSRKATILFTFAKEKTNSEVLQNYDSAVWGQVQEMVNQSQQSPTLWHWHCPCWWLTWFFYSLVICWMLLAVVKDEANEKTNTPNPKYFLETSPK